MSSASLKEPFRYVEPTYPLQPGSCLCFNTTLWKNGVGRTFPHGLAIKLGMIPCVMPTLFAVYLNKIALSAILRAEVYASAVSRTPGPVSVSVPRKVPLAFLFVIVRGRDSRWPSIGISNSRLLSKRSWKYWLLSCVRSREYPCTERMEISIVKGLFLRTYSLPGVKGCRSVKFFFDTDSAVSVRQLALSERELYLDCKTFEVKVLETRRISPTLTKMHRSIPHTQLQKNTHIPHHQPYPSLSLKFHEDRRQLAAWYLDQGTRLRRTERYSPKVFCESSTSQWMQGCPYSHSLYSKSKVPLSILCRGCPSRCCG